MKLKTVIFDLDGVITDSAVYHFQAWKKLANRLNIPFDKEYNENLKGVSRMESLELLLKNGNMQNSFSDEEKKKIAAEKNDLYRELIKQISPEDLLPGILPLLKELKKRKIKTAVASVSKNAPFILEQLKINDYFDYICDAASIPRAKPFPDIFLVAAENTSAKPENCIGIEDAQAGIAAINAAGMKSVGVGTAEQMKDADLILSGTSELSLNLLLQEFDFEL